MTALLRALVITLGVECALAALIFRRLRPVGYVALCSLLTNPAANLLAAASAALLGPAVWWPAVAAIECAVVAAEGLVLARLLPWPRGQALALSLALNGASFCVGLVL